MAVSISLVALGFSFLSLLFTAATYRRGNARIKAIPLYSGGRKRRRELPTAIRLSNNGLQPINVRSFDLWAFGMSRPVSAVVSSPPSGSDDYIVNMEVNQDLTFNLDLSEPIRLLAGDVRQYFSGRSQRWRFFGVAIQLAGVIRHGVSGWAPCIVVALGGDRIVAVAYREMFWNLSAESRRLAGDPDAQP